MVIVIPMAGLSSRFTKAGYTVPKFMLPVGNKNLFHYAVSSFSSYFEKAKFLFIHLDIPGVRDFITSQSKALGIKNVNLISLSKETRGQAESVALGLRSVDIDESDSVIIFNIDTIRKNYKLPTIAQNTDGYIEVFKGEGEGWSFVEPHITNDSKVISTTEKKRISELCSTGLYYFRTIESFLLAFDDELLEGPSYANEFYIAPLYNRLINNGLDIRYHLISAEEVCFSGIPTEYEKFKSDQEKSVCLTNG